MRVERYTKILGGPDFLKFENIDQVNLQDSKRSFDKELSNAPESESYMLDGEGSVHFAIGQS